MTILIVADLHLDLWADAGRDPFAGIVPVLRDLDALIIAGDLANDPQRNWPVALARITRLVLPGRVCVIPGNHDYYGATLEDGLLARIALEAGASLAQKRVLTFGSCRLLCCTLWTDFALLGDPEAAMARAGMAMPDYGRIRSATGAFITPEDTVAIHFDHPGWLTRKLRTARPDRDRHPSCPGRGGLRPLVPAQPGLRVRSGGLDQGAPARLLVLRPHAPGAGLDVSRHAGGQCLSRLSRRGARKAVRPNFCCAARSSPALDRHSP
ncbi:metallophosphoesterase [Paracoccus sp. DMF-8]|uniref:metallophosphoesterase n=1 Tax=Paracoccus sp. DMF-8 TaxID=3019445 RepID=UPI0023E79F20|nr:metallophosphoesterase [Paracoccus sp. DMF-8]MDF3605794.1 metallophosphoesterase [Paracoccus sp. DMF-8]